MKLTKETNILIVGLGVIGGGYAQALTKQGYTVNCITRSPSTIDYAVSHGMIAHGTTEIDAEMIGKADLIVFALYPHIFIEWLESGRKESVADMARLCSSLACTGCRLSFPKGVKDYE